MKDNVVITAAQISELYRVKLATVRSWIAADRLVPVTRAGRGRSGSMLFDRGAVADLVYGHCLCCGNGFKRARADQLFCEPACRKRHWSKSP